jgi:hypothetical protein
MEESTEMRWLREAWDSDAIKQHENEWIAIQGQEVIAFSESLAQVLSIIANLESPPLVAKIVRGPIL